MTIKTILRWIVILTWVVTLSACVSDTGRHQPNILFIMVDDLRPQFAAYGRNGMITPTLDRLATEGVVFKRAFVNVPVCGASRASLMTGLRPTSTRFVDYLARADEDAPSIATLPAHLKAAGYTTLSLGKVLHIEADSAAAWSRPPWRPEQDEVVLAATSPRNYLDPANIEADRNEEAKHNWGELRYYRGIPEAPDPVSSEMARKLRHGYYAATSYADSQIGKLLQALDDLKLAESTIVVLIGDHGWSLGEHGLWAKHSPFDVATHTPLIVRAPGVAPGEVNGLVEFIDIYPTLLAMTGTQPPDHLQGASMIDMLYDSVNNPDETVNLADEPGHAADVSRLQQLIAENIASRGGW